MHFICHCESYKCTSIAWIGSVTNDHNLSPKISFSACINYRIPTDIHLELIAKCIVTVLMSHLQFHKIEAYTKTCMA